MHGLGLISNHILVVLLPQAFGHGCPSRPYRLDSTVNQRVCSWVDVYLFSLVASRVLPCAFVWKNMDFGALDLESHEMLKWGLMGQPIAIWKRVVLRVI